jgi:hypothetical protein
MLDVDRIIRFGPRISRGTISSIEQLYIDRNPRHGVHVSAAYIGHCSQFDFNHGPRGINIPQDGGKGGHWRTAKTSIPKTEAASMIQI